MIEALLILLCVAGATAFFVRAWAGPGRALGVLSIVLLSALGLGLAPRANSEPSGAPAQRARAGYVSSRACQSCHPGEYASWHRSFHRTMTQLATPETVLAPLERARVTVDGRAIELERRGEEIWATLPDPDEPPASAPLVKRQVLMTTGSHHYQAFWVRGRRGNELRLLPAVYLLREQRFIPRRDAFLQPPSAHARAVRWNSNCVQCHSVAGRPQHDESSDRFDTEAVELGIACEACHGPGEAHLARHKNPLERWSSRFDDAADETIVQPGRLGAERASEVCAQCHAYFLPKDEERWWQSGFSELYRPGQALASSRLLLSYEQHRDAVAIDADFASIFWADGTIRIGGREHNGLAASACFQRGQGERKLGCLSCHSMHRSEPDDQLSRAGAGDGACSSCHGDIARQGSAHTHHAAESSGSRCYSCHMPFTSYALFKGIRAHRIDSPSAARQAETGRPNACNLCHVDRTLGWTAQYLERWFGQQPLPAGTGGEQSAVLTALVAGNAAERALAAHALGRPEARRAAGNRSHAAELALLLDDPYSAVRVVAHRALLEQPGFSHFDYDFLAAPDERRAAVARARELAKGATLDQATIAELRARRDETPITLAE
ncbi:MAG TPA: multiheme c-type cytochrome [Polyangiaceae bacterium]|nr:multiheme c-type cytochrome [Polyangiaceae bacterium]